MHSLTTRATLARSVALLILCGAILMAMLAASAPASVRKADHRAGLPDRQAAQYIVRVQVHEQGGWDIRTQEACSDRSANGSQLLDSDSSKTGRSLKPYAWMFSKTGNDKTIRGFYQGGETLDMVQTATVTVEATEQTIDKACDEPVNTCNDCEASTPPTINCGTRTGTLTVRAPFDTMSGPGQSFSMLLNYVLAPAEPYADESGKTYCPNNALSQWQSILALEESSQFTFRTSKALRYFQLNAADQATCQRYAKFAVDKCKANFTMKRKALKRVNTPAPEYNASTYESVVTLEFWFSGICTRTGGKQTCFDRLPNRWKRVTQLPGDYGY